jgi:hypothetical protein
MEGTPFVRRKVYYSVVIPKPLNDVWAHAGKFFCSFGGLNISPADAAHDKALNAVGKVRIIDIGGKKVVETLLAFSEEDHTQVYSIDHCDEGLFPGSSALCCDFFVT